MQGQFILKAARQIRYIFTGELNTIIVTNPHFPGQEKDLLRCQIARIVYGTTIVQDGIYKANPDNPIGYDPIEDVKPPKTNVFVHATPHILQQGRTLHKEIEGAEDPEKAKKEMIDKDPFEKVLRPISEDKPLTSAIPKVKIPAWKIQFLYDDKVYINSNIKLDPNVEPKDQKDNTENYTIVCIRSLRWPGMYVVRYRKEIYHMYFGWVHRFDNG